MNNVPVGKKIYQETHNGIYIHGISYTADDLNQSAQAIADICFDTLEQKDFKDYLHSLSGTGFRQINVVLPKIREWQVGEGFAEAYLTTYFSCYFPWSNNRDLKNLNSSLPGADMVGFHQGQFAFGEVKTSAEQKYPPQVTSKKGDGLNAQLKKLCHDHDAQWTLVQYLYHRTKTTSEYKKACKAYLNVSKKNFYVFGVLVRDVEPNIDDWRFLKKHLKAHAHNKVSLVALYLPKKDGAESERGIKRLHKSVMLQGAKS